MQRYVRLFGTPITLVALIALLVYGAKWGYRNVMAPPPAAPLTPCVTQTVGPNLTTKQVTVRVYNGGRTNGLAGKVAAALKAKGFVVTKTANTDQRVTTTRIVGADPANPEVKLVAGFFKGAQVTGDGRVDRTVDVLVGNPSTGFVEGSPTSIAVPGGQVCLPTIGTSPTPTPKARR